MSIALNSQRRVYLLVATVFLPNLVFVLFFPTAVKEFYLNVRTNPMFPSWYRNLSNWLLTPLGLMTFLPVPLAMLGWYFSPWSTRVRAELRLYIFGMALGALGGVFLCAIVMIRGLTR